MAKKETLADPSSIPPPEEEGFDAVLQKLQGIVERMEKGELSLEESLSAFEQGIALSRRGQVILDAAEKKVEILLRDGTTEPFAQPFAPGKTE